jgi:DNA invertase Pin-like site-specific DNA recombinase
MAWTDRVSDTIAYRRASGRRHYNAIRQVRATVRRSQVARLLRAYGLERGTQARIARELNVSDATISRDTRSVLDLCLKGMSL